MRQMTEAELETQAYYDALASERDLHSSTLEAIDDRYWESDDMSDNEYRAMVVAENERHRAARADIKSRMETDAVKAEWAANRALMCRTA